MEEYMPKYLVKANYTPDATKAILANGGTQRAQAVGQLIESLGGKLESFNFAFGSTDVYAVLELPDNVSAAAASMTVNASGLATSEVVVLLSPEEIDAATKLTPQYRAPGS
jgi:uncharacterized protein with GYD domain